MHPHYFCKRYHGKEYQILGARMRTRCSENHAEQPILDEDQPKGCTVNSFGVILGDHFQG